MTDTKTEGAGNAAAYPEKWSAVVGAFATALGLDLKALTEHLAKLVGEPSDDALETLGNPEYVSDADIKGAVDAVKENVPVGLFRKNLATLRAACVPKVEQQVDAGAGEAGSLLASFVPTLPADSKSFLSALRTGGVLLIDDLSVLSGVRAINASVMGLYDLCDMVLTRMRAFSGKTKRPYTPEYLKLEKRVKRLRGRRSWGEILSLFDLDADLVSAEDRRLFLDRGRTVFVPALSKVSGVLESWVETWLSSISGVGVLAFAASAQQQRMPQGAPVPTGANFAPPDTGLVRAAIDEFYDALNEWYMGAGIAAAHTLCLDALESVELVNDPSVAAACGFSDQKVFVEDLELGISGADERLEQMLAQYVYGLVRMRDVPSGTSHEARMLNELNDFGIQLKKSGMLARLAAAVSASNGDPQPTGRTKSRGRYADPSEEPGRRPY